MTEDQELRELIVSLLEKEEHGSDDAEPAGRTVEPDGRLELTSLELVRLLVSVEEHLDIELDDVEIMNANFDTIDDIVALVGRSRAPSGSMGRT
jgi:acyl carrier protein